MKTFLLLTGLLFLLFTEGSSQTVIAPGATWKYLDNGTNQGTDWRSICFADGTWKQGVTRLSYGEIGDPTSTTAPNFVSYGPSATSKYITTYFRKKIIVDVAQFPNGYELRLLRDDGAVVYINGAEVLRDNMPTGTITSTTPALTSLGDGEEIIWKSVTIPKTVLNNGENTVAVEVHQFNGSSSDMSFNLELRGVGTASMQLVRGPYLQMGTPTGMTLRWRTSASSMGQVRYGTTVTSLTNVTYEATSATDHSVGLTNLTPNTKYYYSIGAAETPNTVLQGNADDFFYTAPLTGAAKKTRIWAMGDFGEGTQRQLNVRNAFMNHVGSNYVDLWFWLGDNAYPGGLDQEYQKNLFDVYGSDRIMKQTPSYATPGNHDYANNNITGTERTDHRIAYFDVMSHFKNAEAGGVPSGKEEYYSFNYGNIHVVSLDSFGYEPGQGTTIFGANGPQITWLKQDLAAAKTNPAIQWTIVMLHHPPYTKGSHDSDSPANLANELRDIRQRLLPVLDQYKVDLVLTGHSHVYERTALVRNYTGTETEFNPAIHNAPAANNGQSSGRYDGSPNSCYYYKSSAAAVNEGIVYVVCGSSGAGLDPGTTVKPGWPHNAMKTAIETVGGSMYLEVEGKRLDAKFIAEDGQVRDQFTIIKDTQPSQTLIASGATWKYLDNGSDPGTAWRTAAYNDASWKQGVTRLSYGEIGDPTSATAPNFVSYGPSATSKYITTYFRKKITISDASIYNGFDMRVLRDDGVVVYVNGSEVYRNNMPAGNITSTTTASASLGDGEEIIWQTVTLPKTAFVNGENTITAEVHQFNGTSSDMSFNMELLGTSCTTATPSGSRLGASIVPMKPDAETNRVTLYPNPTTGKVFLQPALPYQSYTLTDLQGKTIREVNQAGFLQEIDLSPFPSGMYILISQGIGQPKPIRIIKQ
jgi:3',5'-cyclic AMP phosphodiesterase CpdA